ncbi:DUF177 domain-containing protein [Fodinicurvata sp. EGI_FJ10296]|uniref:YceD family protein n=1 Tax=Fodinicurvata sp. EGI_FJ10296 TaxID=3231908 RepID=UPI003453DD51
MTEPNAGMPEFSRPLRVDRLPTDAVERSISAKDGECQSLARRLGLEAIHALSADLTVKLSLATGIVRVRGRFEARVSQYCVVSLESFESSVSEDIDLSLAAVPADIHVDIVDIDPLSDEDPEPLDGNILDIGEIVAQHLSLALDPHPRKPGVEPPETTSMVDRNAEDDDEKPNPFAALARLKDRQH